MLKPAIESPPLRKFLHYAVVTSPHLKSDEEKRFMLWLLAKTDNLKKTVLLVFGDSTRGSLGQRLADNAAHLSNLNTTLGGPTVTAEFRKAFAAEVYIRGLHYPTLKGIEGHAGFCVLVTPDKNYDWTKMDFSDVCVLKPDMKEINKVRLPEYQTLKTVVTEALQEFAAA